jgi:endogenous inhibitor of DNA gyrase (YacG/DUF329 family)
MTPQYSRNMVECPNCESDHTHDELTIADSYSTSDTTYVYLKCPTCENSADYTEWDAFYALYD